MNDRWLRYAWIGMAILLAIIGAAVAYILTAPPAAAHTGDDIDAWFDDWNDRVAVQGLTVPLVEEHVDFVMRHECAVLGTGCPVALPTQAAPSHRGMGTDVEQWRSLVAAYFPASQVNMALCVMRGESGGNPAATNQRSGAAGLMQHLPKYWPERAAAAGWAGASIYDPTANIAVSAWLWRTGGWGHWSAASRC